jgi:hypothetical protein
MKEMECEERTLACTSVSPLQPPTSTQEPSRELRDSSPAFTFRSLIVL